MWKLIPRSEFDKQEEWIFRIGEALRKWFPWIPGTAFYGRVIRLVIPRTYSYIFPLIPLGRVAIFWLIDHPFLQAATKRERYITFAEEFAHKSTTTVAPQVRRERSKFSWKCDQYQPRWLILIPVVAFILRRFQGRSPNWTYYELFTLGFVIEIPLRIGAELLCHNLELGEKLKRLDHNHNPAGMNYVRQWRRSLRIGRVSTVISTTKLHYLSASNLVPISELFLKPGELIWLGYCLMRMDWHKWCADWAMTWFMTKLWAFILQHLLRRMTQGMVTTDQFLAVFYVVHEWFFQSGLVRMMVFFSLFEWLITLKL